MSEQYTVYEYEGEELCAEGLIDVLADKGKLFLEWDDEKQKYIVRL